MYIQDWVDNYIISVRNIPSKESSLNLNIIFNNFLTMSVLKI